MYIRVLSSYSPPAGFRVIRRVRVARVRTASRDNYKWKYKRRFNKSLNFLNLLLRPTSRGSASYCSAAPASVSQWNNLLFFLYFPVPRFDLLAMGNVLRIKTVVYLFQGNKISTCPPAIPRIYTMLLFFFFFL